MPKKAGKSQHLHSMNQHKVLAITKRTAELADTRSLLCGAGLGLMTATNLAAAQIVINAIRLESVIICFQSWTESERQNIIDELAANHPEVKVILGCPGWKKCLDCGARVASVFGVVSLD